MPINLLSAELYNKMVEKCLKPSNVIHYCYVKWVMGRQRGYRRSNERYKGFITPGVVSLPLDLRPCLLETFIGANSIDLWVLGDEEAKTISLCRDLYHLNR
jgi:hypothetical protein